MALPGTAPGSILLTITTAVGLVAACDDVPHSQGVADPLRPPTGTVVVTVRHHFTGELGVGLPVILRGSGTDSRAALTNAAGEASFVGVTVGEWELSYTPPPGFVPWATRPSPVRITVAENQTTRHVFEYVADSEVVPRGDLRVSAVEETLGGLSVDVAGALIHIEGSEATIEYTVQRQGINMVEGLPVGAYELTVDPPRGYGLAPSESGIREATVAQTHVALVEAFVLQRTDGTGGLLGWVGRGQLGPSFVPAAGTVIRLLEGETEVARATVSESGFYWLDDLQPGVLSAQFTLPPGWRVAPGAVLPTEVEVVANRLRHLNVDALEPPD